MQQTQTNCIYADGIEIVIPRAQSHYYLKEEEEDMNFDKYCGSWTASIQMNCCEMKVNSSEEYHFVHRSTSPIPFENDSFQFENELYFCEQSFDEEFVF